MAERKMPLADRAVVTATQFIPTGVAVTGQITVATAGTAVQGSDVKLTSGVWIEALAGNTGVVYFGNDGAGDVTADNGYQLDKGKATFAPVANLNELWFDAATSGDKLCWFMA
jgi:hypothetical protein